MFIKISQELLDMANVDRQRERKKVAFFSMLHFVMLADIDFAFYLFLWFLL